MELYTHTDTYAYYTLQPSYRNQFSRYFFSYRKIGINLYNLINFRISIFINSHTAFKSKI